VSEKVVCVHGQSARQCEMCDADRRIAELEREIADLKNERDDALGIIVGVERAGPQYRALVEEITRWRNRMKARRLEASDGA